MIKFPFYYTFTILKLNRFKSIIILISCDVGFMAHNPKVAGSNPVPATILLSISFLILYTFKSIHQGSGLANINLINLSYDNHPLILLCHPP